MWFPGLWFLAYWGLCGVGIIHVFGGWCWGVGLMVLWVAVVWCVFVAVVGRMVFWLVGFLGAGLLVVYLFGVLWGLVCCLDVSWVCMLCGLRCGVANRGGLVTCGLVLCW